MDSYGHSTVNDVTSVGVNREGDYLRVIHEGATKKKGSVKQDKKAQNYGNSTGGDNSEYSQRGTWTDDDKKLSSQAMPNDRMYSYLQ